MKYSAISAVKEIDNIHCIPITGSTIHIFVSSGVQCQFDIIHQYSCYFAAHRSQIYTPAAPGTVLWCPKKFVGSQVTKTAADHQT